MVQSQTPRLNLKRLLEGGTTNVQLLDDHFRRLSILGNLVLQSVVVNAQPGSPSDGDVYALGPAPTGDTWQHHPHRLIYFLGGLWWPVPVVIGMRAFIVDEQTIRVWSGAAWLREGAIRRVMVRADEPHVFNIGNSRWPVLRTNAVCTLLDLRKAPNGTHPSERFEVSLFASGGINDVTRTTLALDTDFTADGTITSSAGFTQSVVPAFQWIGLQFNGQASGNGGDAAVQLTYSEAIL